MLISPGIKQPSAFKVSFSAQKFVRDANNNIITQGGIQQKADVALPSGFGNLVVSISSISDISASQPSQRREATFKFFDDIDNVTAIGLGTLKQADAGFITTIEYLDSAGETTRTIILSNCVLDRIELSALDSTEAQKVDANVSSLVGQISDTELARKIANAIGASQCTRSSVINYSGFTES